MTAPTTTGLSPSRGGPVPHPAAHYGKPTNHPRARITRRELELLRLAANGNTNEAIGHHLGITKDTVNGTLRRVYLKLGAKDRSNAVAIALVRGVLKPSDIACVIDPGGTASVHAHPA